MAIFRFEAKAGKNSEHFNYIMREDRYKYRKDLEEKKEFNVPKEFDNAKDFFENGFIEERSNANIYREYTITLPKELKKEENVEILERYLKDIFKDDYVYVYAYHTGKNKDNPHAHVMFSERKLDGIKRDKEQYFKRYNPKNISKGGCLKDRKFQKKEYLYSLRKQWEEHLNKYLGAKGIEKVSSKSTKTQRDEALKNNEYFKAELLNKKIINTKLYYNKDVYNDLKEEDDELKKVSDEIYKEYQKEILKEKIKYLNKKSFKEILKLKEELETKIFKLEKNLDDKSLENKAINILTEGKVFKLKNEKRKKFKEAKGLYKNKNVRDFNKFNETIEKYDLNISKLKENEINNNFFYKKGITNKKDIKLITETLKRYDNLLKDEEVKKYKETKDKLKDIDNEIKIIIDNIDKEKLIDKKLELKADIMKNFKKVKEEYLLVDEVFKDKLKDVRKDSEEGILYKHYIEKQDLKKEREKVREKVFNGKQEIKERVLRKKYDDLRRLKTKNLISRKTIYKIDNAIKSISRAFSAKQSLNRNTEFMLRDMEDILRELEESDREFSR